MEVFHALTTRKNLTSVTFINKKKKDFFVSASFWLVSSFYYLTSEPMAILAFQVIKVLSIDPRFKPGRLGEKPEPYPLAMTTTFRWY